MSSVRPFAGPNLAPLDALRDALASDPERSLLLCADGAWTVSDLAARAAQVAAALAVREIVPGCRVALMMGNRRQFFAAQYGIWMSGAVEVSVNPDLRGPSLAHVLRDSDPALVIAEGALLTAIEEADPAFCAEVPMIDVEDRVLWRAERSATEWHHPAAGELASILYTSGTTGPSKGVMLSHGYFTNHAALHIASQGIRGADVLYSPLAFCHVDQHVYLPTCLLTGARLAFRPRFSASRFWADVERFGATWLAAVGWILGAVAAVDQPSPRQRASVRRVLAAPIATESYEFFEDRLGIPMGSMFGQTEADGVTFAAPGSHPRGCAGIASPGFEVQITGTDGSRCSTGYVGEICYRPIGPNLLTLGYWRRPDATVDAWRDLWFHTGDLGRIDSDGFLWFAGRITDSLRRRGENVSAYELEATVRSFPGVRDCAAVATPDPTGSEDEIKLILVPDEAATLDWAEFSDLCESELPRFARPRYVELVSAETLVRGPGTGAIQKHLLSKSTSGPTVRDLHGDLGPVVRARGTEGYAPTNGRSNNRD